MNNRKPEKKTKKKALNKYVWNGRKEGKRGNKNFKRPRDLTSFCLIFFLEK